MKSKILLIAVVLMLVTGCQSEVENSIPLKKQDTKNSSEDASEDHYQELSDTTEEIKDRELEDDESSIKNGAESTAVKSQKNSQSSADEEESQTMASDLPENKTQQSVQGALKDKSEVADPVSAGESEKLKASGTKETHVHEWKPITTVVYHDEQGHMESYLIRDAYEETITEMVYDPWECCNICNQDCTGDAGAHMKEHALAGEGGGRHTEYYKEVSRTVYHEAEYGQRWVVDQEAWNETVITGYQCSCGAIK